jgi:hypothetical protein
MKNLILFFFLFSLNYNGWTQNTNLNYKSALKVYNLSSYEKSVKDKDDKSAFFFRNTNTESQFLHPTIAFQWNSSVNNFHELELTNFILKKSETLTEVLTDSTGQRRYVTAGDDLITTLISLRYEFILNLMKSKEKKWVPSFGFGASPYLHNVYDYPLTPTRFPVSDTYFGIRTFIIPRLTYYMSPKFFLDLNIPVCIFDTYYNLERTENPMLPVAERKNTTYNYEFLPGIFSGRLGVGLKLN